jgi:hypothetical protein
MHHASAITRVIVRLLTLSQVDDNFAIRSFKLQMLWYVVNFFFYTLR